MDCIVHGVAKSWTRLNDLPFFMLHFQMVGGARGSSVRVGGCLSRAVQGRRVLEIP